MSDLAECRWYLHGRGYAVTVVKRSGRWETLSLARAVLDLPPYGAPRVLHLNGDPLDARRQNLKVSDRWLCRRLSEDHALRTVVTRVVLANQAAA